MLYNSSNNYLHLLQGMVMSALESTNVEFSTEVLTRISQVIRSKRWHSLEEMIRGLCQRSRMMCLLSLALQSLDQICGSMIWFSLGFNSTYFGSSWGLELLRWLDVRVTLADVCSIAQTLNNQLILQSNWFVDFLPQIEEMRLWNLDTLQLSSNPFDYQIYTHVKVTHSSCLFFYDWLQLEENMMPSKH